MMTIEDQLLAEIQSTLGSAIAPSLIRSDPSGVFEGYILSLVLRAAIKEGARTPIQYRDVHGNIPTIFEFRTSPGYIASKAKSYTHAVIEFPNKPILEVHVSVRVKGSSKVLHECDVAVITQEEANRCRKESRPARPGSPSLWVSPDSSKVVLAVECKFYKKADLGLNLARSFIGLTSDISSRCNNYFVTSTSSESIEVLLSNKSKIWYRNIIPAEAKEVEMLRNAFQTTFRNFITTPRW